MIKKHILSLMFLLSMLLLPSVAIHASGGETFSLSIQEDKISAGDYFLVTVKGKQVSDLYAYEVNLSFDSSRLQVPVAGDTDYQNVNAANDGFTVGPLVKGNKAQIANTLMGKIPGKNGDVTLAKVRMKAVSKGPAEISIDSVKVVNSQLVSNVVSGNNKVKVNVNEKNTKPPVKPIVDMFNSDIVNEKDLIQSIESKVTEALKSNAKIELSDTKGHWAEKTIGKFVKLKVIDGYEDGSFHPDDNITRAEFGAMIARVFNISSSANHSLALNDIDSHWAKSVIEKLASAGVIAGYEDGTFRPDQTISREEMVVILSRVVNLSKLDKDASKGNLTDLADASSYAVNQIKEAAEAGIINGKEEGIFDPHGNSTRSEALTVILNALNLNPQLKALLDSLD
ncbi:hypothetical protein PAECIP111891_00457 [Paenibacillus allorhizoplanae]|uniref:SLH domain-containing protein n=1 Tax=Paenibacillus allorhizoplanae TaxID=2905648 RepID=A0ABN8FV25_9BACL|nr:S-layer homology domain-containing protein [Paenibacillus allorhizoplanae]CAH1192893.1 hypothetical protein PAECIP111891_00457 [Paenibacillus allorhizoplanae]